MINFNNLELGEELGGYFVRSTCKIDNYLIRYLF